MDMTIINAIACTGASSQALRRIEAAVESRDGQTVGYFRDVQVYSAFQPVYSISHRRAVGYEGLMRVQDAQGRPVSPMDAFQLSQGEEETIFLDRLCRNIHLRNFKAGADNTSWLFLNINPHTVIRGRHYGSYFSDLLQEYDFPAHRIVVEILEDGIQDEGLLAAAVGYYKELGCLVAIDDFGAGHSNFDRIWRISPDIVKLDRSMIAQAAHNQTVRRVLPNLVTLIHESGSLTLMEGVETETEALIAMDSGIDFVQGYYFARPAPRINPPRGQEDAFTELCAKFRIMSQSEAARRNQELTTYVSSFEGAARQIADGATMEAACRTFLDLPRAERCYLLDSQGRQAGGNVTAPQRHICSNPRFRPLADAEGAIWSRRPYFRRALERPGVTQITRPYLSIMGANLCITMSVTVKIGGQTNLLCCDLDWANS